MIPLFVQISWSLNPFSETESPIKHSREWLRSCANESQKTVALYKKAHALGSSTQTHLSGAWKTKAGCGSWLRNKWKGREMHFLQNLGVTNGQCTCIPFSGSRAYLEKQIREEVRNCFEDKKRAVEYTPLFWNGFSRGSPATRKQRVNNNRTLLGSFVSFYICLDERLPLWEASCFLFSLCWDFTF